MMPGSHASQFPHETQRVLSMPSRIIRFSPWAAIVLTVFHSLPDRVRFLGLLCVNITKRAEVIGTFFFKGALVILNGFLPSAFPCGHRNPQILPHDRQGAKKEGLADTGHPCEYRPISGAGDRVWVVVKLTEGRYDLCKLFRCHHFPLSSGGICSRFCSERYACWQWFCCQKKIVSTTFLALFHVGSPPLRQHRQEKLSSAQPPMQVFKNWSKATAICPRVYMVVLRTAIQSPQALLLWRWRPPVLSVSTKPRRPFAPGRPWPRRFPTVR